MPNLAPLITEHPVGARREEISRPSQAAASTPAARGVGVGVAPHRIDPHSAFSGPETYHGSSSPACLRPLADYAPLLHSQGYWEGRVLHPGRGRSFGTRASA